MDGSSSYHMQLNMRPIAHSSDGTITKAKYIDHALTVAITDVCTSNAFVILSIIALAMFSAILGPSTNVIVINIHIQPDRIVSLDRLKKTQLWIAHLSSQISMVIIMPGPSTRVPGGSLLLANDWVDKRSGQMSEDRLQAPGIPICSIQDCQQFSFQ